MREFFAALNSNSKNQKQEQERKRQHRPRKIGGREAGFSATQLAKARAQPQRASALVGDPVRSGRNDDSCVGVRKEQTRARARTKYRDLSTAAAKGAAFGRDDICEGWEQNMQR